MWVRDSAGWPDATGNKLRWRGMFSFQKRLFRIDRGLRGLLLALAATTPTAAPAIAQATATDTQAVTEPLHAMEPLDPLYAAPTTIDRIGRIMAPVMINGQGPFRFIVDTGASRSAISPQLAMKLGLVPAADSALTVEGATGTELVPSVVIAKLEAGDIVLQNHRIPVIAAEVFANAQGILGVEGFDQMRMTVDFVKDEIFISRSRSARHTAGWHRVPVRLSFGRLMIGDATIGNVRVKAVLDTGAERTLGNLALRTALRLDKAAQQLRTESQVIGATAEQQPANSIPSPMIRLGQAEITRLDVTFADLNVFRIWNLEDRPALVLGMDVLGVVRALQFDYKRSELLIRL